jgi:hypothetical protein
MTADEELKRVMGRIRAWHKNELTRYAMELPDYEYEITKKRFDAFLNRARRHHRAQALTELRDMLGEITYFILPWEAIAWYARQKKKTM